MAISPPNNTLSAIQTKVRRLTRSPSENILSTTILNDYINTFILYDLPEHIRSFNLRTTFSFVCNPYQDVYRTDTLYYTDTSGNPIPNQLYDFQNRYITVHDPVYIAGFKVAYTQYPEVLMNAWPPIEALASIGATGDGLTTTFTGTITTISNILPPNPNNVTQNICLVKGSILFESIGVNGIGLSMIDQPVVDNNPGGTGFEMIRGNLYIPGSLPSDATPPAVPSALNITNFIDYVTGLYTVTFSSPPGVNQQISSQVYPVVVGRPQMMLYYANQFTLRPVPDQPYTVQFEVYQRATQLLSTTSIPDLAQWWQYIAYGAAKKVLEDRLDMDTLQMIIPEFEKQQALCLRTTLVQLGNQRVQTIYCDGGSQYGGSNFNSGNGFF